MSKPNRSADATRRDQKPTDEAASPDRSSDDTPDRSRLSRAFQLVRVRLRFVVVLVAIALVVGQWEFVSTYFHRWWDRLAIGAAQQSVSPDTEYFCPMCPGVLSGWPDTCPVCNMPLVRRRKGDAQLLPDGVVARMQFSSQRIQLAGLQLSNVEYRDLAYEFETTGRVIGDQIETPLPAVDLPLAQAADEIEIVREGVVRGGAGDVTTMSTHPAHSTHAPHAAHESHSSANSHAGTASHASGDRRWFARLIDGNSATATGGIVRLKLELLSDSTPKPESSPNADSLQKRDSSPGPGLSPKSASSPTQTPSTLALALALASTLAPNEMVRVLWRTPLVQIAPYRSQPRGAPELKRGEPRVAWLCPRHPEHVHVAPGKCEHDSEQLEGLPLADHQRIRWQCAKHPEFLSTGPADSAGSADSADSADATGVCPKCPSVPLVARVITYAPEGKVLAIPESAVIDTGREQLAYVETGPGMYDGVKVKLGARAGGFYPVLEGLVAGQRVVTRGAFLVDAESRLNPSVAATYFGAAGTTGPGSASGGGALGPTLPNSSGPGASGAASGGASSGGMSSGATQTVSLQQVRKLLAKIDMPGKDRELAERQRVCPVTGMALGSMGKPPKMTVDGEPVFLCCEGCESGLAKLSAKKRTPRASAP